jgi:acyl carrier protein
MEDEESAVERELVVLWKRLLDRKDFPRGATFVELGGDSLLILNMMALVEEQFGVFLEPEDILGDLTVCGVSKAIVKVRGR